MKTISSDEAKSRPPDVQVIFSDGDYDHALTCFSRAQGWIIETGQMFRQDIYGIINHPHHPKCPVGEYEVPPELLGVSVRGWNLTIDIWCADAEALESLWSLPLPEEARMVIRVRDGQ
jgi:hypothetical protein